jgi:uncharacterized membrane protein HdeD (DUF308 family)
MKVAIGTLIICLSMTLIMFSQWYSGTYWLIVGIFILIAGFNDWKIFNKKIEE